MSDVRIEHVFACSEQTFWEKLFWDDEYNQRLFIGHLGFTQWKIIATDENDRERRRTIDVLPKTGEIPAPVKKVIGETLGYREEGVFDKAQKRYRLKVIPSKMADKLSVHGELWTTAVGDREVRRFFTGSVVCKIFGVGGLVEKRIIDDMKTSYASSAEFTNRFIVEKGLG